MRRWAIAAGIGAVLMVAAGAAAGAAYLVVVRPNYPQLAPADLPAPGTRAEAQRQDLERLRQLPEIDRSFSPEALGRFDQRIDGLLAEVAAAAPGGLDDAGFELGVTRAVALAENGHTYVRGGAMGRSLNALPLRLVWFDDGLYVVSARAALADLLGARVVTLGGRTPEALAGTLRPYFGGRDSRARLLSVSLISSPAALHALGLLPSPDAASLVLDLADGRRVTREIAADPRPAMRGEGAVRQPAIDLLPTALPEDDGPWQHVLSGAATLPLYLQQGDRTYWQAYPDAGTLFVELRGISDDAGTGLADFLAQVVEEASRRKPKSVIVDLRANPGGNYVLTADFTRRLPQALGPEGRIYVLTGPDTFSAAITTLARLKYFAPGNVEIVGQATGDFTAFWAEGGRTALPNSGISIRYASAFHDWRNGCGLAEIGRCFWLNYVYGVAAGDLSPTVPTGFTFADYRAGRDPALDAIAARGPAASAGG
ncbi:MULTISPECIES: hypothetical protein [unclassified Inquilinus]|uniref:hypothetical protein n=1 Tax=unclassified Inquilinus TaxID=2645927 RepID=UPI003F90C89C